MAKTLRSFRLSDEALADLRFCMSAGARRMSAYGYLAPSEGEILEQALKRLAAYYRTLKLPAEKAKRKGA